MQFLVTESARAVGIVHPMVVVYKGVYQLPKEEKNIYQPQIDEVMSRIERIKDKLLSQPEVVAYHALFSSLGCPNLVPAGEKLLKSFEKGFKSYGNLVDAYNLVALDNVECLGMHDAGRLDDVALIFRRAHGDEKMVPSFKTKVETLGKGHLTYGFYEKEKFTPLAWLGGRRDIDNSAFQLNDKTRSMMMTVIGNGATSEEYNIGICKKTYELLKLSCPEATMDIHIGEFIEDAVVEKLKV